MRWNSRVPQRVFQEPQNYPFEDDRQEHHTEPSEKGYRLVRRAGRGETLESVVLPTLTLPVDAALG
jgi:hypothetical protein